MAMRRKRCIGSIGTQGFSERVKWDCGDDPIDRRCIKQWDHHYKCSLAGFDFAHNKNVTGEMTPDRVARAACHGSRLVESVVSSDDCSMRPNEEHKTVNRLDITSDSDHIPTNNAWRCRGMRHPTRTRYSPCYTRRPSTNLEWRDCCLNGYTDIRRQCILRL